MSVSTNSKFASGPERSAQNGSSETQAERTGAFVAKAGSRLSGASDLSTALESLLIELAAAIGAAHVFLFRHDPESKLLRLELAIVDGLVRWGTSGEEMALWAAPFPDDVTPAWKVMCEHRELFTPAMTVMPPEQFAWPGAFEYAQRFEMSDIGHIVLFAGEVPVGSIGLGFRHGKTLQADDKGLVEAVAGQAAIALRMLDLGERARQTAVAREREAAAEQRAAQLAKANSALSRSMVGLSKSADFDQALDAVLGEIVAAADASVGFLFGYDSEKNTLRTLFWLDETGRGAGNCPHAPLLLRGEFDADITPFFRLFVNTPDILTGDLQDMPQDVREMTWPGVFDWHLANGRRCACAIPILIGERPLGIIGLAWHHSVQLSLEQKGLLFSLAGQAAVVVQLKDLAEAQRAAAIARAQEQAAREQAQQLSKANRALQTTIDALSTLSDLNQFVPAVLQAVARAFGAADCAYYQHGENEPVRLRYWFHDNRVLTPEELLRVDGEMMEVIRELAHGFYVPEDYLGTPPRKRNRAVVVDHMKGTGVARFDEFAVANGWDLELNVPLVVNDAAEGALIIYRKSDFPYSSSEIALAETLGKQMALAMQTTSLARQARDMAIAQERENAAQQRAAELARANDAMQSTIDALSAVEDLEQFVPMVLRLVAEAFGTGDCAYYEQPEGEPIRLRYWLKNGRVLTPADFPSLEGEHMEVARELARGFMVPDDHLGVHYRRRTKSVVVNHIAGTSVARFNRFAVANGWELELNVPLLVGGFADGAMTIYRRRNAPFSPAEIELAETLGKQVALAMQGSRLARQVRDAAIAREREIAARERSNRLAAANEALKQCVDALVHARDDAEVALGRVLAVLSDYLRSESAALWLADPASGRFDTHLLYVGKKVISARDENHPELRREWGGGRGLVLRRHIEERRPVVYGLDDISGLSRVARADFEKLGMRTMIGVPLLLGDRVIGCLTVRFDEARSFDRDDLELAQAIAHQATATIQMSRMAERGRNAAVTEERNRLAREVHDTLAQGYAGILMQIGAVEAELTAAQAEVEPDSIYRPFFSTIRRLAQDNLAEARRSVAALRPVALEHGDLSKALRQAVENAGKQYVATPRFVLTGSVRTLPAQVEAELLRIAIEGLSNAFQHGGPGVSVTVELYYASTGSVRIAVSDNGRGFDASAPVVGHFGLLGMNERASRIGAELTLVTAEGEGTEVVVVWSPQSNRPEAHRA